MQIIKTVVYEFNELDDKAKERARQWYREDCMYDDYWSGYITADAKECFKYCGWDVSNIYWSGFSSQGAGACFEGAWNPTTVSLRKLKKHAPAELELHAICRELSKLAKQYLNTHVTVKHSGHYSHCYCTCFEGASGMLEADENHLINLSRDLMNWVYKALEREWNHLNADKVIDELLTINNYNFTKAGKVFNN